MDDAPAPNITISKWEEYEMENLWLRNLALKPEDLPASNEILDRMQFEDESAVLESIQRELMEKFHKTLVWRYPLSFENSVGGFIVAVQEGLLWIPYGETSVVDGDLLIIDDAHILSESDCEAMEKAFRLYAEEMCGILLHAPKMTVAM